MNLYPIFPLLSALCSLLLGVIIFIRNSKKSFSFPFLFFCSSLFVWFFGCALSYNAPDERIALLVYRIAAIGQLFMAPSFYHFTVNFMQLEKEKNRVLLSYIMMFFMLPFLLFSGYFLSGIYNYYWGYYPKAGLLHLLYVIISFVIFMRAFHLFYKRTASLPIKAGKIKYIIMIYISVILGTITDYIPAYGIEFYPFGFCFELPFISIIAYAFMSRRFGRMEVVVQKAKRIIVSFSICFIIYFCFFYIGYNVMRLDVWKAIIFAILPCLFCFIYLIWRMHKIIFKKDDDYQTALLNSTSQMIRVRDPIKLVEKIADTVYNIIEARQISIFLLDNPSNEYILKISRGRIPSAGIGFRLDNKTPIINWFEKAGDKFYKERLINENEKDFLHLDLIEEWLTNQKFLNSKKENIMFLRELQFQMKALRASLIIPSCYGRKLLGFLCLGGRKGTYYRPKDIEVLSSFADDVAMNIRNAFLISGLRQKIHEKSRLTRERYIAYQRLEKIFKEIVSTFALAVRKMDPLYTYGQIEKTFIYAYQLVDKLKPKEIYEKPMVKDIFLSGILLHDIGKIFVPREILNKKGRLNEKEWEIIKRHPIDGYELLKSIEGMGIGADIIRSHHERVDGTGYPDGLTGLQIPIGAKIAGVVDAFEAMTMNRPYKKAISKEQAIEELIKNSGIQFDAHVVSTFVELYENGDI